MQSKHNLISSNNKTGSCHSGTESSQMGVGSEYDRGIPYRDFPGIEKYDESMQIYFRDSINLCRVFSLTMACKMRLFDMMMESTTSSSSFMSVKDISTCVRTKNSLSRMTDRPLTDLLSQLETQGFVESDGPYESRRFRLTDLTKRYFLTSSESSVSTMYLNLNRFMKSFEEDFTTNFSTMSKTSNHSEYKFVDESETRMVLDYFNKVTEKSFERMSEVVDFSKFRTVCDVRGSCGLLCSRLKRKFPQVSFTSFDNPTLESYVHVTREKLPK